MGPLDGEGAPLFQSLYGKVQMGACEWGLFRGLLSRVPFVRRPSTRQLDNPLTGYIE